MLQSTNINNTQTNSSVPIVSTVAQRIKPSTPTPPPTPTKSSPSLPSPPVDVSPESPKLVFQPTQVKQLPQIPLLTEKNENSQEILSNSTNSVSVPKQLPLIPQQIVKQEEIVNKLEEREEKQRVDSPPQSPLFQTPIQVPKQLPKPPVQLSSILNKQPSPETPVEALPQLEQEHKIEEKQTDLTPESPKLKFQPPKQLPKPPVTQAQEESDLFLNLKPTIQTQQQEHQFDNNKEREDLTPESPKLAFQPSKQLPKPPIQKTARTPSPPTSPNSSAPTPSPTPSSQPTPPPRQQKQQQLDSPQSPVIVPSKLATTQIKMQSNQVINVLNKSDDEEYESSPFLKSTTNQHRQIKLKLIKSNLQIVLKRYLITKHNLVAVLCLLQYEQ